MRLSACHGKGSVKRLGLTLGLALASVFFSHHGARAADADPSQIEQNLEQRKELRNPDGGGGDVPVLSTPGGAAAGEIEPFLLTGIRLTGAELIAPEDFISSYEEFMAQEVTGADLMVITQRLTQRLKAAGYSLSYAYVPAQDVSAGVLTIDIIAGRIGGVSLNGVENTERLRPYFSPLLSSEAVTQAELERAVLLVHDLSGLEVSDIAVEESNERGLYDLTLQLAEKNIDASFYADSRGTRAVGPIQAGLSAAYNGLMSLGDRLSITYFTTPETPQELHYVQGGYDLPLGHSGLLLSGTFSYSDVDAGDRLSLVNTRSGSTSGDIGLRYPLIRTRGTSLWIGGKVSAREAHEKNDFGTVFEDSLRVLRGSVDYTLSDEFGGQNYVSFEVSQGLTLAGGSRRGDSALSRPDAGGAFTKAKLEAYRHQDLFGTGLALVLQASAQKSADPLLSAEEFSLGGARFGRAYQYGELTGDDGLAGSIELGYTPELGLDHLNSATLYGFYDVGAVWNRNALGDGRESLASAGGGLRFQLDGGIDIGLEAAKPLTRATAYDGDDGMRYFFTVSASF